MGPIVTAGLAGRPVMPRRQFLRVAGSASLLAAARGSLRAEAQTLTIIDAHTHFFDPQRPEGVPWPGKDSPLYRPTYVRDYLRQPVPTPVTGTVVIEASPWVEDNQWVLDLARADVFIVGLCGNLDPMDAAFPGHLRRFGANPRFRGIRLGGAVIQQQIGSRAFIANVGRLADRGLQLDVNGPPESLPAVLQLSRALPTLSIVIDHLANVRIDGKSVDADWRRHMAAVAAQPRVSAKVSGLVEAGGRAHTPVSVATDYYASHLDVLWTAFGEDRLIYGSNWPVSGPFAPLADVQRIVHEYFGAKSVRALEKVFSGNARVAYGLA